jgi:hypothetical protein
MALEVLIRLANVDNHAAALDDDRQLACRDFTDRHGG